MGAIKKIETADIRSSAALYAVNVGKCTNDKQKHDGRHGTVGRDALQLQ
jgi:hypothetical protein